LKNTNVKNKSESTSKNQKNPFEQWNIVLPLGFISFLIFIGIVLTFNVKFCSHPEPLPVVIEGSRTRAIQLEVVNAADVPKLAQRATDFLRSCGFDVVEIYTRKEGTLENTIVIDRAHNIAAARAVVHSLGLPEDRIIEKADPNLYLDVTVIIGKDYRIIKPLQDLKKE
jgi:hypothetical protein